MSSFLRTTWSPIVGGLTLSILIVFLGFYGIQLNIIDSLKSLDFIVISIIGGAFISSCFSQDFGIKIPPKIEILKAIFAGIFMGVGSVLSLGDNIGGFYTASSNLSASGLSMFIGLFLGTLAGLKYLIWEAEKFPSKGGFNIYIKKLSFLAGLVVLLIFLWKGLKYFLEGSKESYTKGIILILSVLAGFIFHRSKLCMAKAMREPFISGESSMTRAFAISLFITVPVIAYLKFAKFINPDFGISSAFIISSLIGGILFGLGMVLADSCALSMLWKLSEGQIKLLIVGLFFILGNSVAERYLAKLQGFLEDRYLIKNIFLPEYLTYSGAVFLIIGVIFIWLVFAEWSRKTKKFVIKV
jgi:uncharacterized membrane protein YedE/YeeE